MIKNGLFVLAGILGCFLFLTLFTAAEEPEEGINIGIYSTLHSKILDEDRRIIVCLPVEYERSRVSYPVLYILDAEWRSMFVNAATAAQYLSDRGACPRMIIVGVLNTHRDRDMIPAEVKHRPGSGGSALFLEFISKELVPYVNKTYRTAPFHILNGRSNSGLFTVYAFLKNPEVFQAAVASSPMIGHCRDFMYAQVDAFELNEETHSRFLYMPYGDDDLERVTEYMPDFFSYLKKRAPEDLLCRTEVFKNGGHVPYAGLYEGLRFVFSGWRFPKRRWMDAKISAAKRHFEAVSKKYGYEQAIPLDILVEIGYGALQRGEMADAEEALILAFKNHPFSPDALYYLGEVYEKTDRTALALEYFKKALQVDPDYGPAVRKMKELKKKK
jgi:predicted alpha/beta superfamily hydrolase